MRIIKIFSFLAAFALISASCQETPDLGPEKITIDSKSKIEVPLEGLSLDITLTATVDWRLQGYDSSAQEWITITPLQGQASADKQKISIEVAENFGKERTASLVFYGNMNCYAPLTITQEGAPEDTGDIIYSNTFLSGLGDFTIENKNKPSAVDAVWKHNELYGMVATAYVNEVNYDSESWLVSPVIDLRRRQSAYLNFEHAANFFSSVSALADQTVVWAREENGEWAKLSGVRYPDVLSWAYVNSSYIDLSAYLGKKMQFAFAYKSTSAKAGTWEVKNVLVSKVSKNTDGPDIPDGAVTWTLGLDQQTWEKGSDSKYGAGYSATVDDIKLAYYKYQSSNDPIEPKSDHIRIYKGSVLSVESQKNIKQIIMYATDDQYCVAPMVIEGAGEVALDAATKTIYWTGDSNKIVLNTSTGQVRIFKIVFISDGGSVNPPTTGPGELKPDAVPGWLELPATNQENHYFFRHDMTRNNKKMRNYSFYYDPTAKLSTWVAYPLNKTLKGTGERSDAWAMNPKIPEQYQQRLFSGYSTNYQRGHQLPSADRYGAGINEQTFYFTNIVPQKGELNAGAWGTLEGYVRNWSEKTDTLYVVTGADFKNSTEVTYDNAAVAIPVPTGFYKALLAYKGGEFSGIAFYFDHKSYNDDAIMNSQAMSIDALEQKLGLDFFVNLPAKVGEDAAKKIEASEDKSWWNTNK